MAWQRDPSKRTYHTGTVGIDPAFPDALFPALVRGDDWNGWAIPYFTRDVADRIIAWHDDESSQFTFEWAGDDLYVIDLAMRGDPDGRELCERLDLPDSPPVYGIGAGSWCWEQYPHNYFSEEDAA